MIPDIQGNFFNPGCFKVIGFNAPLYLSTLDCFGGANSSVPTGLKFQKENSGYRTLVRAGITKETSWNQESEKSRFTEGIF